MDVVDLREFYASPLGQTARRLIAHRIRKRWKTLRGATVLGLGYATPYLGAWREDADRLMAFMPARQGVLHWPPNGPSATALVDEADLPLDDSSVDLALIVHGLELSDQIPGMLQELWRVLSPQGRALFIVPNRRGMWARFDSTPFGYGRPFSRQQLTAMLREAQFSPSSWANALFFPPLNRALFTRSAPAWERVGLWTSPGFSGLIMVEAFKQVYAVSSQRQRGLAENFKPQIVPVPAMRSAEEQS